MKKISKIISLLACIAILCTAFAGCGGKEERVTTDGKSFTFWCVMNSQSKATMESYSEMLFYQEMERHTGVHIDFIHPVAGSTGSEAFVTMISGDVLPDMIEYDWVNYSGGPQAALDDGVLVCLNDYLEEYAPNFYNYVEGEEAEKRDYSTYLAATTESGNYYGFNILNLGDTECFYGLYVRGDLLDKWGMDLPETLDDWTAYLAKAKAEGFKYPLTGNNQLLSFKTVHDSFNTAFGVGKNFYLEGDKVVFGPMQKGYKEYIAQMADWYKKGYIDPGVITNDKTKVESNLVNGISAASVGNIGSGLGKIGPALKKVNPNYVLAPCPNPVAKKGDELEFQIVLNDATTKAIGITTDCGNYEAAVSWCDWIYSEQGIPTQLFGKEGDTYTIEEIDGEKHYVYTDKVLNYEASGFSSLGQAMHHYGLPANHPGYNQHNDYVLNYYQTQYEKDAVVQWNKGVEMARKHTLPVLSFTIDETAENTDITELCQAPMDVHLYDIIMGKKSIDEYEKGVEELAELGYNRQLEIYQAAYDRYLAKKDKILKKK